MKDEHLIENLIKCINLTSSPIHGSKFTQDFIDSCMCLRELKPEVILHRQLILFHLGRLSILCDVIKYENIMLLKHVVESCSIHLLHENFQSYYRQIHELVKCCHPQYFEDLLPPMSFKDEQ